MLALGNLRADISSLISYPLLFLLVCCSYCCFVLISFILFVLFVDNVVHFLLAVRGCSVNSYFRTLSHSQKKMLKKC